MNGRKDPEAPQNRGSVEQTIEQSRAAVARVAREALARRLGDRAAEIPPLLIDAVASGRGDRRAVLELTQERFGTDKPLDLVLFDTDRIASYVFESSRPPVITGASKILRDLNDQIASKAHAASVIFSGGGEGLLLVPAGEGETLCQEIESLYALKTVNALKVTTGFLPVGPQDFVNGDSEKEASDGVRLVSGTPAVLSCLRDHVRRKKDERCPQDESVPGSRERCVSCRDRAAGTRKLRKFRPDAEVEGSLCDPCARRWEVGRREIGGLSFEELIGKEEEQKSKSKYIGFLYVDGNSMGAIFGRLGSLAEIRFLSQAVREVFEQLRSRAMTLAGPVDPDSGTGPLFVSYLGGGDEVIWILPGSLAVQVAAKLQEWIEEESQRIADLPRVLLRETKCPFLTFGAGLVLCGYTYPVRYQYSLAKALQKNAKSIFYGGGGKAVSAIDFEVLTESSPLSEELKSARALTDRTEEPKFWRSCRPYTAGQLAEILSKIRRARAKEVQLATSQLYALQNGVKEGRRIFLNFLRYQIARKPAGEKYQKWLRAFAVDPANQAAVEAFFIQPLEKGSGTWIADGLQLAPFLEGWEG